MNKATSTLSLLLLLCISVETHSIDLKDFTEKLKEKLPTGNQTRTEKSTTSSQGYFDSPVDELGKEDIRKSELIGKYTGCIVGGAAVAIALEKWLGDRRMRVLGASAGCILGGKMGEQMGRAVGERAAARRKQYAQEHDYLESEIAASERAIETRKRDIASNETEIESIQARISELAARSELTRKERDEAKSIKAELEEAITKQDIILAQYEEKIAYLNHALETSKAETDATAQEIKLWETKHASLTKKRDGLIAQKAAYDSQRQLLAQEKNTIDSMLES